jgi:hypothetical protein
MMISSMPLSASPTGVLDWSRRCLEMAWDGTGQDPWIVSRLDSKIGIARVEGEVRHSVWTELSSWLVGTARRLLRGSGPPDPYQIWSRAPLWSAAVDKIVRGPIRGAMGSAYRSLLGENYDFGQRPFVSEYLAQVKNRMVRTPDQVYDLVASEVSRAVIRGEGVPELRDRIELILSITDTERWPGRATTIARTEAIGALNASRYDAFVAAADEEGLPMEKQWLSTVDDRTRHSHREADGQRVPVRGAFSVGGSSLLFPGDPSGPPQEVINCRCTMLLVPPEEDVDMSDRQLPWRLERV